MNVLESLKDFLNVLALGKNLWLVFFSFVLEKRLNVEENVVFNCSFSCSSSFNFLKKKLPIEKKKIVQCMFFRFFLIIYKFVLNSSHFIFQNFTFSLELINLLNLEKNIEFLFCTLYLS